jgi:hypothetical protein
MTHDGAVEWMARHGHPEYANQIRDLKDHKNEIIGDAGRYWQYCEFTQAALAKIDAKIEEIGRRAWERYEDWRTDPLP